MSGELAVQEAFEAPKHYLHLSCKVYRVAHKFCLVAYGMTLQVMLMGNFAAGNSLDFDRPPLHHDYWRVVDEVNDMQPSHDPLQDMRVGPRSRQCYQACLPHDR